MSARLSVKGMKGEISEADLKALEKICAEAERNGLYVERNFDPRHEFPSENELFMQLLLKLPNHLRRTASALYELKKVTAKDVSKKTKRARAVESAYLNQLVRMRDYGIEKGKEGRKTIFYVSVPFLEKTRPFRV